MTPAETRRGKRAGWHCLRTRKTGKKSVTLDSPKKAGLSKSFTGKGLRLSTFSQIVLRLDNRNMCLNWSWKSKSKMRMAIISLEGNRYEIAYD